MARWFLLARIKEAHDAGADTVEAVATGLAPTGRIVTTAAALLAITFFAFGTAQVSFIQLFGIGTGIAIVLDATVIRGLLVPAFMRLAGQLNWWSPDEGYGAVAWGVRADDVIMVLDMLDGAGVRHWVGGGWGVAALVGRQTREHRDLDLAVDAADLERCWQVLGQLAYAAETDWLPVRMELRAPGARWVDVHPVQFGADGHGRQPDTDGGHFEYPPAAFTTGSS